MIIIKLFLFLLFRNFENGSVIPELNYKTNERITNIQFSPSDISKIIRNLNPNEAHGHGNISK